MYARAFTVCAALPPARSYGSLGKSEKTHTSISRACSSIGYKLLARGVVSSKYPGVSHVEKGYKSLEF